MRCLILFVALLKLVQQVNSSGVITVHHLPPPEAAAAAGKEVSDPRNYDDSQEARKIRVDEAKLHGSIFVRIDDRKRKSLNCYKNIVFDSLDVNKKHLFRSYTSEGKLIESFYLSFEGSNTSLHLRFNSGYANWRISTQ